MPQKSDIIILKQQEIESLLNKQENKIMDVVQQAYELHSQGKSVLPHSSFLTFPDNLSNRIIALPAYLGEPFNVAGIKWIASFPANIERDIARASAVLILNSMETGHPLSIMESSIISAKRTAASAALAAKNLVNEDVIEAGFIGCGLINLEIFRFLSTIFQSLKTLTIFDKQPERATAFVSKVQDIAPSCHLKVATSAEQVLESTPLISLATTAATPYIYELPTVQLDSRTILLISLRDISPQIISTNINIVDDPDHVCRANTSIHLAQQQEGNTDFIKGTLVDVIQKRISLREKSNDTVIFSPFGLGVLDVALGKFIYDLALNNNLGTKIESFISD
ncbi:MAG: 2,3-diaminopropionate biosynthesis protein SbnB [Moorea sp. SIOASIH]|uniref:2,3-diaminopropionate biosynthesis protein SbnB n=1 Tax=Moorena sp. SIOASIH TaxID=2607817 RepID=UPI0013BE82B8|nr:2,3-diaminopropionate biosynthesis protein SbnB [Moorena sp. SIOASIH]NEO41975.1 2,3-diaminopropionate biosynthesis protein SbnB [Moorena sp. SIOASIH]